MNVKEKLAAERKALKENKQNLRNQRKEKAAIERRMNILKKKVDRVGKVRPPGKKLKMLEKQYKSLYFKYQTGQTSMSRERDVVSNLDNMEEDLKTLREQKKNFFKSRHWQEQYDELEKTYQQLSKQVSDLQKAVEKSEKIIEKILSKMPKEEARKKTEPLTATYSKEMPKEELNELADKIMKKFMAGEKITSEELSILQKVEGGKK